MSPAKQTSASAWGDWLSRFDAWTPAQKSFVAMLGFALPAHLGYRLAINLLVGSQVTFAWVFWFGMGVVLFIAGCSAWLMWRKSDSRLPYLLLSYGYSSWALAVVVNVGAFDNIYGAFPVFLVLAAFLFDGWRMARHIIAFWTVAALVIWVVQSMNWLDYGPGFAEEMDLVRSGSGWLAVNIIFLGLLLWSSTAVLILVTTSRAHALSAVVNSRNLIRRYLPPSVADQIIEGREREIAQPQRRRVTVLFADIVGFTDIADRVEPEVMTQVLGEYMSHMAEIVSDHGGTLNEFAGDGFMALFGAPSALEPEVQAEQSMKAAVEMQASLSRLNDGWRPLGLGTNLRLRVGINTGMVSVGSYGSQGRMTYTAIGLQTNIASRIEATAAPGEVLISDATYQLLANRTNLEPKGEIDCKGVHFRVPVYRVLSTSAESR
ncbi:MAG: adenylate/guanylate cyclase domain-containing protein [Oceanococcus sp.]